MTHAHVPPHATNRVAVPELVVWTSLWGRNLPYVMGEAEQKRRFSYALRRAMLERNVSARALAKTLGIDPRRITSWQNAKGLPNLYESQALAVALKVDESLFRDPPEVPPPPPEPYYPIEKYLQTAGSMALGRRRATKRLTPQMPDTPVPTPEPLPRKSGSGRA